MNSNCKYEVNTSFGWVRLDEGAFQDYLAGRLWLNWSPDRKVQKVVVSEPQINVSDEALKLRDMASKSDAYSVCCRYFPTGTAEIPFSLKMTDISIDELCLSVRSSNGLMRAGASTLGKVKELMEKENGLRSARNLGLKSEKEIKLCFFNGCYALLNEYEKAAWWQRVIDANSDNVMFQ